MRCTDHVYMCSKTLNPKTLSFEELVLPVFRDPRRFVLKFPRTHGLAQKMRRSSCCTSEQKSNCRVKALDSNSNQGSGKMKKLTAIILGTLFVAAVAFTFNTVALAAPGGHPAWRWRTHQRTSRRTSRHTPTHRGHGGHWRHLGGADLPFILQEAWTTSAVWSGGVT